MEKEKLAFFGLACTENEIADILSHTDLALGIEMKDRCNSCNCNGCQK